MSWDLNNSIITNVLLILTVNKFDNRPIFAPTYKTKCASFFGDSLYVKHIASMRSGIVIDVKSR